MTMGDIKYQPVIIIGAPRSGTNMLRDILCEFNGVGTWPCDEINYIWKHGNIKKLTDELDSSLARLSVKRFVGCEFNNFAEKQKLDFLVEKTCANSLRIPFIDEVIPDAKYVFIVRDGVDAVGSATLRWKAKLDIPYILKKVRYVPIFDLPYYALRYFCNMVYRLVSKSGRLSFWGPQFRGLKEALEQYSLEQVCALQWQRCVELSEKALSKMPKDKVIRVSYEAFVSDPEKELIRILQSLNIQFDECTIKDVVINVTDSSIGKGRRALDEKQLADVNQLISFTLEKYGYAT